MPGVIKQKYKKRTTIDGMTEIVDVFSMEGGEPEAVTSRIRSGWKKYKEIFGVLCKKGISLRIKEILYQSYVMSALCYGAECWAMRMKDKKD